jgi:long-chain fatty acid transport protein
MKVNKTKLALAVAFTMGVAAPGTVLATNGYFSHGYGAASNGMAGTGVAFPQDAMAAAVNPAGMVMVGDRGDVGAAVFSPLREYDVSGPNSPVFPPFSGPTVESGENAFLVPSFGMNWMLDDKSSVGVTVYGNGGMNTSYDAGDTPFGIGTFGAGKAGVDYMQLFVNASYARKIGDNASWGVSGIMNYSRFMARGLSGFAGFSLDPANLSNNGYDSDVGFGLKVGVMGEVAPGFSLGASYQSKIQNTMDNYAGLFADSGSFDIPATATIGMAYKPSSQSAFTFDIQQIYYSDVDAVANPVQNLFSCMGGDFSQCLGGKNGAGFGWEDMTVYKLGYMWSTGNDWTWRVGVSTGDQPIPGGSNPMESQTLFNILAPGVMEEHFTFGFSKKMAGGKEFSMAFMYAPEVTVSGANAFNPAQNIDLTMKQYQVEAGFSW